MPPSLSTQVGKNSYLSDILVADLADLLNVGGALRDVVERVAGEDKLVLLRGGNGDVDALGHDDAADNLLADEVADLNLPEASVLALVDVDVDGEMRIDVAHLVLEALCHTNHHVVDDGLDGSQGGDILAVAVVDLDRDGVLGGVAKVDGEMAEVLDELAAGTLDGDDAGLDGDLDCNAREKVSTNGSYNPVVVYLGSGRRTSRRRGRGRGRVRI